MANTALGAEKAIIFISDAHEKFYYENPYFSGKNYSVHSDMYHNDDYPACLMVQCGIHMYKVRFPGVLNKNSVQSERTALKLLAYMCVNYCNIYRAMT